jgi:hypothetical protein
MKKYYTYAYLREDRTPYYVGKGTGKRAYKPHTNVPKPKERNRIIILKENLTEQEAFRHEIYMIAVLGRKDLGTGILRNLSPGGYGGSGGLGGRPLKYKNLGNGVMIRVPEIVTTILPQLQDLMQQIEENGEDSTEVISSVLSDIEERLSIKQ